MAEEQSLSQRAAGWPAQVKDYFQELQIEMKRVTWPSRDEWVSATLITVGLVVTVAIWTSVVSNIVQLVFRIPQ